MPGLRTQQRLEHEARSLLERLGTVQPFGLHMPMVPAAAVSAPALAAIEALWAAERRAVMRTGRALSWWLRSEDGRAAEPALAQRRLALFRLKSTAAFTLFDIFSDVLTQRSEHDNGIWLAGLDATAHDMLAGQRAFFEAPPLVTYLDRGHGAAIRRWATRLPGGALNPVAVLRIPRERMVSSTVAGSLAHEVGHQAAALLDLVAQSGKVLRSRMLSDGSPERPWRWLHHWRSEILADLWSVGQVGVGQTLGLMAVLTLPAPMVFGGGAEGPHPVPWIRVLISCALGRALFPHPQWERLAWLWQRLYPIEGAPPARRRLLEAVRLHLDEFARIMISFRPPKLLGACLADVLRNPEREPRALLATYERWCQNTRLMFSARPALAFAVLGQARAAGRLNARFETQILKSLLTHWAMQKVWVPEMTKPTPALAHVSAAVA